MKCAQRNLIAKRLYQELFANCADYVAHYAITRPQDIALIEDDTGCTVSWQDFDRYVNAYANTLHGLGLKTGNIIATSLALSKEHVFLIYACYRLGLIVAPLDTRLKQKDLLSYFAKMQPASYFFAGRPVSTEFRETLAALQEAYPKIQHWVQVQKDEEGIVPGGVSSLSFLAQVEKNLAAPLERHSALKTDPCLIIFTTGSTGSPKPALLSHENILVQTIGFKAGFDFTHKDSFLVNLPPSHVGCTTEQLGSIVYAGGTAVLLPQFDPQKSLEAVQKHRVTIFGQIPAMFVAEWRLSNFSSFDLSSVRVVMYGGQGVSKEFLEKLRQTIAPKIASGLGLTELAGFCTYTDPDDSAEDIAHSLGYDSPLCPLSVRDPMTSEGYAGAAKKQGEVGEICFSGPQVFLGYLGDAQATRATVSLDGTCYTGDLGSYDHKGLHFAGRAKFVIKPKGYQVFPGDIENHILEEFKGRLSMAGCVGAPHELYTEGIMLFVETVAGANVLADELNKSCRALPSYARPSHIEILSPGQLPLNRVGKTDYQALKQQALERLTQLRVEKKWDNR